jgi:hypothetical protein
MPAGPDGQLVWGLAAALLIGTGDIEAGVKLLAATFGRSYRSRSAFQSGTSGVGSSERAFSTA